MTQTTYLLEIGTEELPAGFLETSYRELQEKTREALEKHRFSFDAVKVLQTPRRLALMIEGLATRQPASEELMKGPPVSVGLDASGNPTPAAVGFAKKMGIDVTNLAQQDIDGTAYLTFLKKSDGQSVEAVLPEILPEVVLSLSGSHFMCWDTSEIRFSRPIRWLVSMLGDQHLPVQIGLAQSTANTRGHRFFAKKPEIAITSVASYATQLAEEGSVIVDQDERRKLIQAGLQEVARSLGGSVPENEALLDTVTMLVEAPALIAGNFESRFLTLPKPVITTVMAAHQKYFPVEDAQGKLMPHFITISNNTEPKAADTIRHGNEKVLRARLEDASFFYQEDTKQPLSGYVEHLAGITFQKGLGSLLDKTNRLKTLVAKLGELMAMQPGEITDATRAAELCKADLGTGMVRELTELQGVIGQHYAEISGEKPAVALAIAEHYQPRFMGDSPATSPVGSLLSLADKLDTLMAVFAQKDARYPTGSKDPMGLRRMSLGVIQTVLENGLNIDLDQAFERAYHNLGSLAQEAEADAVNRTRQFVLQRFKGYLLDQQFSYDTIEAVLDADLAPLTDLNLTLSRLAVLKGLQQDVERFKRIYEPANRVSRILAKAYQQDAQLKQVDTTKFEDNSEKALYEAIVKDFDGLFTQACDVQLAVFDRWAPHVEAFFEKVLVNAEDAGVKANRYVLLSLLNRGYRHFADFTKLVV